MIKNYFLLVKNKILRNNKKFILNSIMIIIMLFALITTLSLSTFIKEFTESNYNSNYHFKKLFVSYDTKRYSEEKAKDIISRLPNIELISSQDEFFTVVSTDIKNNGDYSFKINLISCTPKTAPRTINGNTIAKNTIIIPDDFKPKKYNENLSGQDFIGKQIKIKYNIIDYTPVKTGDNIDYGGKIIGTKEAVFNVIGTYDNNEYFEMNNSCYILNDDMNMLFNENIKYAGEEIFSPLVVICDYYSNVEDVIFNLKEYDMFAQKAGYINTMFTTLIVTFGYTIAIFFMFISIITTWSFMKIDIQKNKTEYALLKCMGYKDSQIFILIFTEQMIISITSLIISCFLALVSIYKIRKYIESSFDSIGYCEMKLSLQSLFIGVLISFVLPTFILLLNSIRLRKISPIEANK